jgi:hypothetical protein
LSLIDKTGNLERLQFFNGQQLVAEDLQALEAFNRELRWLHNQSLHQPGVGSGFVVSGQPEAREVSVSAGYAIDGQGREIVLVEDIVLPIPPVAGGADASVWYDLTLAYPDDSALEEVESRQGVCTPAGATRLREAPAFCWVELTAQNGSPKSAKLKAALQAAEKVPIARIEVRNCRLKSKPSIAGRASARPTAVPFVAAGRERLRGEHKLIGSPKGMNSLSVRLFSGKVSTAAAGFLTVPQYLVRLVGPRTLVSNEAQVQVFDRVAVEAAAADSFDFVAQLLFLNRGLAVEKIIGEIEERWFISWVGVER